MTISIYAESKVEYTYLLAEQRKLGRYPKTRICLKNGTKPKIGRPRKVRFKRR